MGNLKSFSSSFPSLSTCSLPFLLYSIYLFSNLSFVDCFGSRSLIPQFRNRLRGKVVFHVGDYGAKGDGFHDDTKAIRDVWEKACSFPTTLKVVINFPAERTFLIQPTDFSGPCIGKVTLKIKGSIIAPIDPEAWEGVNPRKWLYFHGIDRLSIEGGGAIDGRGHKWWARSCKMNNTMPCEHAPSALTFYGCNNLKITDLVMINSQQMHLVFTNCMHVTASQLKVIAPASSPNTDGIHISSSIHVQITSAVIETGDDCISIVGNSTRIGIRNIVCGPGHGISIGSLGKNESLVEVRDVMVDGVFLSHTKNGLRIKTWQGGSGSASNITFQNIYMENVSNPIIIDQYYCDSLSPCSNETFAVKVEDVSFMTIRGTSATEAGISFACSDIFPCKNLYLEDIQLVRYQGGLISSFCWQAEGLSSSLVYPPPCFPSVETLGSLKLPTTITSNNPLQSI
ncbi:probable polygalacturonase At1g80170 [Impatiens glandulifera]|uniref:probable polygalacturonase At1g80170 n=1 Tax=Impatiens glandulifera TaxID=253017 RepID=UPI001FB149D4|nr:probable polygalacturonase At1g80170 [Impatiens glandulifera]